MEKTRCSPGEQVDLQLITTYSVSKIF